MNTKKTFEIIPVIDLLNGQVVHAKQGDRQRYQPIQSLLCDGSEPLAIVQALLELYPFDQLYIADLNAIQKHNHHQEVVSNIQTHYPHLKIWLDAGISSAANLDALHGENLNWVFGSESFSNLNDYLYLIKRCGNCHMLSLDFTAQGFMGPGELIAEPSHWPDKTIAMTLGQIGSNLGPDFQMLEQLINRSSEQKIYAAGGVRHKADIQQLKKMGSGGALIASSLHNQQITSADLGELLSVNLRVKAV